MGPEQSQHLKHLKTKQEAVCYHGGGATPEAAAAMYDEMQNKKN
jgi:hypothetical protein